MPVSVRIKGGVETARALSLLGRNSSQAKVLRQALRPGARVIANAARSAAPRGETGALRKSIAIESARSRGSRNARLTVGHRRDDPFQRWRISHIIEYGSRFVSARPYMRPAHQNNAQASIASFGQHIWLLIAKELTRVRSRAAIRTARRR